MSRLEDAVNHDLGTAPTAPPVARMRRRARRRRVRRLASGALPVLVVAVAAGVAAHSVPRTRQIQIGATVNPTTTAPAVTSTTQPAGRVVPYATEARFPGLTDVVRQVHDYEVGDGPVATAEMVATTRAALYGLFGGSAAQRVDTTPVYLVRLTGSFICDACSSPSNATIPHGSEILFVHSPTKPLDGAFSVGDAHTDLSNFGPAFLVPPFIAPHPSPGATPENEQVILTPAGQVADGQIITVTVTGFPVGDRVWLSECASADDANPLGCGPQLVQQAPVVSGTGLAADVSFVIHDHAPFEPGGSNAERACSPDCVVMATTGDDGFVFQPVTFKGQ